MGVIFESRDAAARQLAKRLERYAHKQPLVLAIPRGGVPMGRVIADALQGELDIVLVRKLGAPDNPELAVGAIDETGQATIATHAADCGADAAYLETEKGFQWSLLRRRRAVYTPSRASIDPAGRTVIVVDDGLATGTTMIAALKATRARQPARLICAVPVASPESLELVRPYVDELVCLSAPRQFDSVGRFYAEFPQVEDSEVIACLSQSSKLPESERT